MHLELLSFSEIGDENQNLSVGLSKRDRWQTVEYWKNTKKVPFQKVSNLSEVEHVQVLDELETKWQFYNFLKHNI